MRHICKFIHYTSEYPQAKTVSLSCFWNLFHIVDGQSSSSRTHNCTSFLLLESISHCRWPIFLISYTKLYVFLASGIYFTLSMANLPHLVHKIVRLSCFWNLFHIVDGQSSSSRTQNCTSFLLLESISHCRWPVFLSWYTRGGFYRKVKLSVRTLA
jgi:hypothetical protein